MPLTLEVVAGPSAEPLSLAEAKAHLNVDLTADDVLIGALIAAARESVEEARSEPMVTRTFAFSLDQFPSCGLSTPGLGPVLHLPRWPLRKVISIQYVDTDGLTQTLAADDYQVDAVSCPPRLIPAWGKIWPITREVLNAVTVMFIAGHATPFAADAGTDTLTAPGHPLAAGDRVRLSTSGGALPTGVAAGTDYFARDVVADTLKIAATVGGAALDLTAAGNGLNFLGEVPPTLIAAMKLLISHWYENREASTARGLEDLPLGVQLLLQQNRVRL